MPDFFLSGYGHRHISGSLNFIFKKFRIFWIRPFSFMLQCFNEDLYLYRQSFKLTLSGNESISDDKYPKIQNGSFKL